MVFGNDEAVGDGTGPPARRRIIDDPHGGAIGAVAWQFVDLIARRRGPHVELDNRGVSLRRHRDREDAVSRHLVAAGPGIIHVLRRPHPVGIDRIQTAHQLHHRRARHRRNTGRDHHWLSGRRDWRRVRQLVDRGRSRRPHHRIISPGRAQIIRNGQTKHRAKTAVPRLANQDRHAGNPPRLKRQRQDVVFGDARAVDLGLVVFGVPGAGADQMKSRIARDGRPHPRQSVALAVRSRAQKSCRAAARMRGGITRGDQIAASRPRQRNVPQ